LSIGSHYSQYNVHMEGHYYQYLNGRIFHLCADVGIFSPVSLSVAHGYLKYKAVKIFNDLGFKCSFLLVQS
jgi:hypothetical protein